MNLGSALSKKIKFVFILGILMLSIAWVAFAAPDPIAVPTTGLSNLGSQHRGLGTAAPVAVVAGNITEIRLNVESITQSWAGFYGSISADIVLDDAVEKTLYEWSQANPTGEVYASRNDSVDWSSGSITCFNLAANAATLDTAYNITSTDADKVANTFSDSTSHAVFAAGANAFVADACPAVQLYRFYSNFSNVTNITTRWQAPSANFTEVLLSGTVGGLPLSQPIFTSLVVPNSIGFDNSTYDYEMIVLEDGHKADTATTNYYFYVELQ